MYNSKTAIRWLLPIRRNKKVAFSFSHEHLGTHIECESIKSYTTWWGEAEKAAKKVNDRRQLSHRSECPNVLEKTPKQCETDLRAASRDCLWHSMASNFAGYMSIGSRLHDHGLLTPSHQRIFVRIHERVVRKRCFKIFMNLYRKDSSFEKINILVKSSIFDNYECKWKFTRFMAQKTKKIITQLCSILLL